ncbi:MAG: insulinase family protein [Anaerolineales bacterium]|uniref:insulinase family protein n=1 Tax=Candidatus Villigracilis vicinus TaxID=3140679 RepID=UPI00313706E2|nr:insulinase family protein [Anaerolineales bacterium]
MAAKNRSSMPSPEDVYQTTLPNGITVLARSNFNSPAVNFGGYLPAGALFETDEKLGLADFVSSMLMRGTQTRTFDAIYNELETVGASLGFDLGRSQHELWRARLGGRTSTCPHPSR